MAIGSRMMRLAASSSGKADRAAARAREESDSAGGKPVWALIIPWEPSDGGGVNQVVLNLAAELRRQGRYEPVVIVLDWRKGGTIERHDGVRHIFIRLRDPREVELGLLARLRYDFLAWREARDFRRLLRRLGARIVNFHYPVPAAEHLLRAHERRRYRILFSLHGLDIVEATQKSPAYRARYLRMLAEGDGIVAVSEGFADLVTRELAPELAGKLTIIRNGVASRSLDTARPLGITLPRRYILNVATFEAKKGQLHLIEAFARLAAAEPDLHLVIAGRPESALPAITEQIRALGLDDRTLLLRDVPHAQIGTLFASASLFCLSSLAEPFGIVLLEAGLFGLPVVATRVGGVPEIIRDGENGILVEPGDSAALAEAMRRLLDRPHEAAALAASLRARVLAEFQWPASVARYVALAEQQGGAAPAAAPLESTP
jgi:glycosyltransferase involved in cell wall biosynthesis